MGAGGDLLSECGKRPEYESFDILSEVQRADGNGGRGGKRNNRTVTNSRQ